MEGALQLGRREALVEHAASLRTAAGEIDDLLARARERRERGIGILDEWMALQSASIRVQRHLRRLEGEARDAEIEGAAPDLGEALRTLSLYEARSIDATELASTLRRLGAVRFDIRGGVVPRQNTDWFASLTLSYELGAVRQRSLESEVIRARDSELRNAAYELRNVLEEQLRRLHEQSAMLGDELRLIEEQIATVESHVAELARAEGVDVFERLALARIELVELRGEATYLRVLLTHRESLPEVPGAH
jgi:hypothetical protein